MIGVADLLGLAFPVYAGGDGAPAVDPGFASDDFSEADGTAVVGKALDVGGTWTAHPANTSAGEVRGGALRRTTFTAGQMVLIHASDAGTSNAQEISVTLTSLGAPNGNAFGIVGYLDGSLATYYGARYLTTSTRWEIIRVVSGTVTVLGSYTQSLSADTPYEFTLRLSPGSQELLVDGVSRVTATDTAIAGPGYVGIRGTGSVSESTTTGWRQDNFNAVNLPVGSAAGGAAAAAAGASLAAAAASASGIAIASGIGSSLAPASGSASGTSTVGGVGASTEDGQGMGDAAGLAAVAGVGASIADAVGSASGLATVAAVGLGLADAVGSASGTSAVAAAGLGLAPLIGSASGTSAASAAGASAATSQGDGSASGVAAAAAVGAARVAAAGSASGTATALGSGASAATAGAGSSAGIAAVNGVGAALAAAVGTASGTSDADAESSSASLSAWASITVGPVGWVLTTFD